MIAHDFALAHKTEMLHVSLTMNGQPPPLSYRPSSSWGWKTYGVICTFFLLLSLLGNVILLFVFIGISADRTSMLQYEERFVAGDPRSSNKIAVINLNGIITLQPDGKSAREGMVGDIRAQLRQALNDRAVKAIILRINSPGGEVVASDTIYRALIEARDQKNIVAYIETVGASGAYYTALGCSQIVANEMTITGSIGVIISTLTFGDLMTKVGIKSHTFKSGEFKDILNPTREPTESEKAYVQALVMEIYDKFVGIVAEERDLPLDDLKANGLVDGRIFSGNSAVKNKLADEVGDFEDAVNRAMALADISSACVIRYRAPFSFQDLLSFVGPLRPAQVQVQFDPRQFKLEPGQPYLLPSYMFE